MKSYHEMANNVLRKIKKHEELQKCRKKFLMRTVTPILGCCFLFVLGIKILPGMKIPQNNIPQTVPADISKDSGKDRDGTYYSVGANHDTTEIAEQDPLDHIVVNPVEPDMISMDMDAQLTDYKKIPESEWHRVLEEFYSFTAIRYSNFTARLSDRMDLTDFFSVAVPELNEEKSEKQYHTHDYVFRGLTTGGGKATIALSPLENPLRDYFPLCDNPETSEINGIPLTIYGWERNYTVQFTCQNINYDIETSDVSLEELLELLTAIICEN